MKNQENTEKTETETISAEAAPAETEKAPAKPKKPKKKKVGAYPFRTKAQIREQIAGDDAYALHCLGVIYDRQTEHEQENKTTKSRNARGFMSSHAKAGTELAVKVREADEVSDEDVEAARELAGRYVKQLANHFRAEQIAADPKLAKVAKVYSAS